MFFDNKHSSFIRNLQVYGFKKIKTKIYAGMFCNQNFQRSDIMKCLGLKPIKGKNRKAKEAKNTL